MIELKKKYEPDEYLAEFYWGIGFGITKIDHKLLIIMPFVIVLITSKEVYKRT